jgi:hypothetical protein
MLAGLFGATPAVGDLERGKLLYDTRCIGCHDKSVHNRPARKAQSIADIQAQVRRWDMQLGGGWRNAEVNDVTAYLNKLYYGYPCPAEICPEAKVRLHIDAAGGLALAEQDR